MVLMIVMVVEVLAARWTRFALVQCDDWSRSSGVFPF